MSDDARQPPVDDRSRQKRVALELVFIAVLGLFVVGGFIAALSYDFVSARAPIVIMVPLFLLIALQFNKTRKKAENHLVMHELKHALRGENQEFNSVFRFMGFMALLLVLIWFTGHYVGIAVFMFAMLYWISREHPILAVLVAVGVTLLIYVLFEHVFNIELYRGYLPRLLMRQGIL